MITTYESGLEIVRRLSASFILCLFGNDFLTALFIQHKRQGDSEL
jgi:hypothetical protein